MNLLRPGKIILILVIVILVIGTTLSDEKTKSHAPEKIVVSNVGFSTPESVEYYAAIRNH